MRVAFAGSPRAAAIVLGHLNASPHEVALVISQPDRPRGRGGKVISTSVAEKARELGIPVVLPATINADEVLDQLREAQVGALCVVAFGQILRQPLLSEWMCINVHYSLLPAYRGAAPVERAIMDGRTETGVTIMRMDAGLDTGPIISITPTPIAPDDDAGQLLERLSDLGGPALISALDELDAGRLAPRPQPEDGVTMAPKITDADRALDPARPASELADRVRALSPHIGAQLKIDREVFKVWRAVAHDTPMAAGLDMVDGRLMLAAGDGALEIVELQPPGRARMAATAFVRGWRGSLEVTV